MARALKDKTTIDMFDEYVPRADVVPEFAPERVRAPQLSRLIARGISEALADSGKERGEIVQEVHEFLGEGAGKFSENILNAYASESREDQTPNIIRFAAITKATGDPRLLNLIAQECGWIVVDKKYKAAIDEAMIGDEIKQREQEIERLRSDKNKANKIWRSKV